MITKDLRQRERWLAEHPEDATPDDVVDMTRSLIRMRDAVHEQAQLTPGTVAVIVTLHVKDRSLRFGMTAPAMDDDRIAAVAAKASSMLVDSLQNGEPEP